MEESNTAEEYNECPASAIELLADIETFRVLGQPKEALNRIDLYVKSQITKLEDENKELQQKLKSVVEFYKDERSF